MGMLSGQQLLPEATWPKLSYAQFIICNCSGSGAGRDARPTT